MAERPDYDQALKALLLEAHDGFLALIAPGVIWRQALSPELPAVKRQADLVWEVSQPGGKRGILHVELQLKVESDIGERVADYGIRLRRQEQCDIRSVVVYLRQASSVPPAPFIMEWMGRPTSWYDYDIIRLWELPRELVLDTPEYELWPLSALMAESTVEATATVALRLAEAPLPKHRRGELTSLLLLFAGMRLPRPKLMEVLGRNHMLNDLLKESGFLDALHEVWSEEAREEGLAEGREEGLAEGREEGLAEGRAEQARAAIKTVLTARFGALDEALAAAIDQLDQREPATLNDLLAACATEPLERIRERLGVA